MKHNKKKLGLKIETLRSLTNQELGQIAGGDAPTVVTCPTGFTCTHPHGTSTCPL